MRAGHERRQLIKGCALRPPRPPPSCLPAGHPLRHQLHRQALPLALVSAPVLPFLPPTLFSS